MPLEEIEKPLAVQDATGILRQHDEEIELVTRECSFLGIDPHRAGPPIEFEASETKDRVAGAGQALPSPQDRPDPGQKLARVERLRQVIVGADLEADDPVRVVAARGQHEDRHLRTHPDPAADFEAVDVGQHDVQDDGVEARAGDRRQAVEAGRAAIHREACSRQVIRTIAASRVSSSMMRTRSVMPRFASAPVGDVVGAEVRYVGGSVFTVHGPVPPATHAAGPPAP